MGIEACELDRSLTGPMETIFQDMLRDRCVGILRLADCKVQNRPTNKEGFCFKIYHTLHYPIYHKYGLKGETLKMASLPGMILVEIETWNHIFLIAGC